MLEWQRSVVVFEARQMEVEALAVFDPEMLESVEAEERGEVQTFVKTSLCFLFIDEDSKSCCGCNIKTTSWF